jgi:hypothetical protein
MTPSPTFRSTYCNPDGVVIIAGSVTFGFDVAFVEAELDSEDEVEVLDELQPKSAIVRSTAEKIFIVRDVINFYEITKK